VLSGNPRTLCLRQEMMGDILQFSGWLLRWHGLYAIR
jgi:hypothetical protein